MLTDEGALNIKLLVAVSFLVLIIVAGLLLVDKEVVAGDEYGIIVSTGGKYRLVPPGQTVKVLPVLHEFFRVSISPKILSLLDDEGIKIGSEKHGFVTLESQLMYDIGDIENAVKKFGYADTHLKIRQEIARNVSSMLKEKFDGPKSVQDSMKRVTVMAETNIELNDILNKDGVNIGKVEISYK